MAPRKTYSAALKAKAVLALLKEDQTFGQVAASFGVHPEVDPVVKTPKVPCLR